MPRGRRRSTMTVEDFMHAVSHPMGDIRQLQDEMKLGFGKDFEERQRALIGGNLEDAYGCLFDVYDILRDIKEWKEIEMRRLND